MILARQDFIADDSPLCPACQSVKNARADLMAPIQNPTLEYCQDARRFEEGNANYCGLNYVSASLDLIADVGGIKVIERYLRSLSTVHEIR